MKDFFDKYAWIYGASFLACAIGTQVGDEDMFNTILILMGVPPAILATGYFAFISLKTICSSPFDGEWDSSSLLGKIFLLFQFIYLLLIGVAGMYGVYWLIKFLLSL